MPIYAVKTPGSSNLVKAFRTLLGWDPSAGGAFGTPAAAAALGDSDGEDLPLATNGFFAGGVMVREVAAPTPDAAIAAAAAAAFGTAADDGTQPSGNGSSSSSTKVGSTP